MIYLCKARDEYADQTKDGKRPSPFVPWYDKAFGFVVIAESEAQARQFCAEFCADQYADHGEAWLDSEYTSCEELPGDYTGIALTDIRRA